MSKQESKVWVTGWANRNVYHTNSECQGLKNAKEPRQVKRDRFPNFRECKVCKTGSNQFEREELEIKTCDACGDTYKELAAHIRGCDEI